jgi:hypothetical protein
MEKSGNIRSEVKIKDGDEYYERGQKPCQVRPKLQENHLYYFVPILALLSFLCRI